MTLKDLKGKTVYDLEWGEFVKLFCPQCKDCGICVKDFISVNICMGLIDSGIWDRHLRNRQGK